METRLGHLNRIWISKVVEVDNWIDPNINIQVAI